MTTQSNLVVKSNRLVEASYRLSLNEQRLILFAITQFRAAKPEHPQHFRCTLDLKKYAALFNIQDTHRNLYRDLREAAEHLFQREATIYEPHPKTGKLRKAKIRWLMELSENDKISEDGELQVVFTNRVIPYFYLLEKNFTQYHIEQIAELNSVWAIRFYELLKQYEGIGERTISIKELRERFELVDKYKTTGELKRRVVNGAITNINEKTDLKISCRDLKKSRQVVGFHFGIQENPAKKPSKTVLAIKLSYSEHIAKRLWDEHGIDLKTTTEQRALEDWNAWMESPQGRLHAKQYQQQNHDQQHPPFRPRRTADSDQRAHDQAQNDPRLPF